MAGACRVQLHHERYVLDQQKTLKAVGALLCSGEPSRLERPQSFLMCSMWSAPSSLQRSSAVAVEVTTPCLCCGATRGMVFSVRRTYYSASVQPPCLSCPNPGSLTHPAFNVLMLVRCAVGDGARKSVCGASTTSTIVPSDMVRPLHYTRWDRLTRHRGPRPRCRHIFA